MDDSELLLRVRYKFKGQKHYITITVTEQQYVNFLALPIIETCEIVERAEQTITESEKKEFNKQIKLACTTDISHTKYLLQ